LFWGLVFPFPGFFFFFFLETFKLALMNGESSQRSQRYLEPSSTVTICDLDCHKQHAPSE